MLACALGACQDTASGPALWTLAERHAHVGLSGGHQGMACADCHQEPGGSYQGLDADCEDCHLAERDAVTDPDHVALGYGTACGDCHASQAWRPAASHHDTSSFALEGGHAVLRCSDCHEGGVYEALPQDCWSCHHDGFEGAEPDHVGLDFGRDCTACHTLTAWTPATFDHAQTGFVLDGAHLTASCSSCHGEGFADTPTECTVCHADDEPTDHFGPACAECHTTTAWRPSTFDHEPQFPLQRGAHQRYRDSCASCHLQTGTSAAAAYAAYTCTDCHDDEHTRSRTDSEHREVRNYRYESAACYDCHPTGREEEGEGDD